MNGNFRIAILALIGVVIVTGAISILISHDSAAVLQLCTLVCVSLLALLHQGTARKLDSVAEETAEQTVAIKEVKRQTDGLTEELVKKSERIAFNVGKEAGAAEQISKQDNGGK